MSKQFLAVVPQGLDSNTELKQLLGKLKRTIRERDQEVRWTQPALWHVTLQFLGEVPPAKQGELRGLLQNWKPKVDDLTLRLHGLGAFPAPEEARVLWVGVQENQEFLRLQAELAALLNEAGFPPDERDYHPHLTLARFRNHVSATALIGLGGRKHFGDYKIGELVLFESVLQGNILKYVPQLRLPL